jgi:hypothetical protein
MIYEVDVCSEGKEAQQKYSKLVGGDQSSPTFGMGTPPKGYTFANWIPWHFFLQHGFVFKILLTLSCNMDKPIFWHMTKINMAITMSCWS